MGRAHLYRRAAVAALILVLVIASWWLLPPVVPTLDEPQGNAGVATPHSAGVPRVSVNTTGDQRPHVVHATGLQSGSETAPSATSTAAVSVNSRAGVMGGELTEVAAAETQRFNPSDSESRIPRGWSMCFRQSASPDYLFASDFDSAWSGSASARIALRAKPADTSGAGICQVISAAAYKGSRIELTMHLRTRNALPGAHLLFRADAADGRVVAFYNMQPRWIDGTSHWAPYSVVIDLPEAAAAIVVGASLVSTGDLWIDDVDIHVVDRERPLTHPPLPLGVYNNPPPPDLPRQLENKGFEETVRSAADN